VFTRNHPPGTSRAPDAGGFHVRSDRSAAVAALILAVGIAESVAAGPFDDADAAYKRGDYATALRLFRPQADRGNAYAQASLGMMYETGHGLPQDYTAAASWYRKAADQGVADAQHLLGYAYGSGRGVPQDDVSAYMWFNLAATQGVKDAARDRDGLAAKMTPAQIAEAQKRAAEWRPKKANAGPPQTKRTAAGPFDDGVAERTRADAPQERILVPRSRENPSFNCAQAKTAAARLICADAKLAQLDGELGVAFQKRKAQSSSPETLVAEQLSWIRERNTRCELVGNNTAALEALASSKPCMVSAIQQRIAYLAQTDAAAAPAVTGGQPLQLVPPSVAPSGQANAAPSNASPAIPLRAAEDEALRDGVAAHERGEYATAMRLLRPLADQGNAGAEFFLALMYVAGQGVVRDDAAAISWYRKAADQGHAGAQYSLGIVYPTARR
jgi:TPR repeat protein